MVNEKESDLEMQKRSSVDKIITKSPQIATAAITMALLYSMVFNFGYFSMIGFEFLTYLTIEDFLEGTVPFLIVGFLSVFIYAYLGFTPNFKQETLPKFIRRHWSEFKALYSDSDTRLKKALLSLLSVPIAAFFFALQFFGNYLLYFIIFLYVRRINASLDKAVADGLLPDIGSFLYVIAAIIVVADIVFRHFGTSIGNRHLVRFGFVSMFLAAISGIQFLSQQLVADKNWIVTLHDGSQSDDLKFMRAVTKGVFLYDQSKKAIMFLGHDNISSVEFHLNVKPENE